MYIKNTIFEYLRGVCSFIQSECERVDTNFVFGLQKYLPFDPSESDIRIRVYIRAEIANFISFTNLVMSFTLVFRCVVVDWLFYILTWTYLFMKIMVENWKFLLK